MPYLNWKTQLPQAVRCAIEKRPDGRGGESLVMTLGLSVAARRELAGRLEEVLSASAEGELRLDLPNEGWAVFWKKREGGSRLLVSHPQESEWVATAALCDPHALLFLDRLGGGGSESIELARLGEGIGAMGSVSNLELVLETSAEATEG